MPRSGAQNQQPHDRTSKHGSVSPQLGPQHRGPSLDTSRAQQIKSRVLADFDRVVDTLESAAALTAGEQHADALTVIAILREIRETLVSAGSEGRDEGAYLIVDWQDATEQVRRIVANDRAMSKNTRT